MDSKLKSEKTPTNIQKSRNNKATEYINTNKFILRAFYLETTRNPHLVTNCTQDESCINQFDYEDTVG